MTSQKLVVQILRLMEFSRSFRFGRLWPVVRGSFGLIAAGLAVHWLQGSG